jgi:hypothetical protein
MTPASLVIVADRGGLRAYSEKQTPTRGPSLHLVQAFDVPDVLNAVTLRHRTPMSDWPQMEAEMERRACTELALAIARIVEETRNEGWSLAAPESIYWRIVELLPAEVRGRIVEHVESDLVKIPAAALPQHFRSLQPL